MLNLKEKLSELLKDKSSSTGEIAFILLAMGNEETMKLLNTPMSEYQEDLYNLILSKWTKNKVIDIPWGMMHGIERQLLRNYNNDITIVNDILKRVTLEFKNNGYIFRDYEDKINEAKERFTNK